MKLFTVNFSLDVWFQGPKNQTKDGFFLLKLEFLINFFFYPNFEFFFQKSLQLAYYQLRISVDIVVAPEIKYIVLISPLVFR